MKKVLLTSVSTIALLAAAPSLAAGPAGGSWSGCYVGANAGGGWGQKTFTDTSSGGLAAGSATADISGFLIGGQAGCNYEIAPSWIVGIEGAFSAGDISGSAPGFALSTLTAKTAWIASLTGRVGHSWDNWLAYVKGGAAWADDKYTNTYSPGWTGSETRSGWTLGAGLEWAFADKWSARLEYDYFDFGTSNVAFTGGGTSNEKVAQKIHSVLVGVNYHFPVGPMPAMQ